MEITLALVGEVVSNEIVDLSLNSVTSAVSLVKKTVDNSKTISKNCFL
jgi:hypothetical protein